MVSSSNNGDPSVIPSNTTPNPAVFFSSANFVSGSVNSNAGGAVDFCSVAIAGFRLAFPFSFPFGGLEESLSGGGDGG